jgi:hypothetical protein
MASHRKPFQKPRDIAQSNQRKPHGLACEDIRKREGIG